MTITINGSGTVTGVTTLATTNVSQTLTTPVVTTTIGVGNATPSGSGSGITFPATQSASSDANTLDDYEEGTWTPNLKFGATSQSLTITSANYTKIGRIVFCAFDFAMNSNTGSGSAVITGFPFTQVGASTGTIGYHFGMVTGVNFECRVTSNSFNLTKGGTAADASYTTSTDYGATTTLLGSFSYITS